MSIRRYAGRFLSCLTPSLLNCLTRSNIRRSTPLGVQTSSVYEEIKSEALATWQDGVLHGAKSITEIVKRKEFRPHIKF